MVTNLGTVAPDDSRFERCELHMSRKIFGRSSRLPRDKRSGRSPVGSTNLSFRSRSNAISLKLGMVVSIFSTGSAPSKIKTEANAVRSLILLENEKEEVQ